MVNSVDPDQMPQVLQSLLGVYTVSPNIRGYYSEEKRDCASYLLGLALQQ